MIIYAKYKGRCVKCKHPFSKGTMIEWVKGKGVSHPKCTRAGRKKLRKWDRKKKIVVLTEAGHRRNYERRQLERKRYDRLHSEAVRRIEKGISPPPKNWRELSPEERFNEYNQN